MINKLKSKIWVFLVSPKVSKIIYFIFVKNGFISSSYGKLKVDNRPTLAISLLFWGLYEREDLYYINKYIKNDNYDVIEFGASLGLTTLAISNKTTRKIVSVEANPNLYDNLLQTKAINNVENLTFINAVIDYSGENLVKFTIHNSSLSSSKGCNGVNCVDIVPIKLIDIIKKYDIQKYFLVCDIEGAEVELFLEETDKDLINNCVGIIIELHPIIYKGVHYDFNSLIKIILNNFNMKLIDSKNSTCVFMK